MTSLFVTTLTVLLLSAPLTPAFAECTNAKCTDTMAIEQARATIQTTCAAPARARRTASTRSA
jgi:hypothetical protein